MTFAVPVCAVGSTGTGPVGDPAFMGTLEVVSQGLGGKAAIAFADSGGAGGNPATIP